MQSDLIVATITGPCPGAVAIVRVSGEGAWKLASKTFKPWQQAVEPRFALYGTVPSGEDALALPFAAGASFTGEESVEFHIHGSRASVESILEACLQNGARMARPGEFTERAFLNGKLDLTQAEAIRDLVEAATDAQLRQANLLREGALSREIEAIINGCQAELAKIEAHVDFSEEIGDYDREAAQENLTTLAQRIEELLRTADAGRFLRNGLRIVIAGRPNAGKSSLLNALLGRDRTIVSATAGTTRDYVEESIELGGALCALVDTAGLRESEEDIEAEGIRRSQSLLETADFVWYLYDGAVGWTKEDQALFESITRPCLLIRTKADLPRSLSPKQDEIAISAITGDGLDRLRDWARITSAIELAGTRITIRERHAPHLAAAFEHLQTATQTIAAGLPFDLASVALNAAIGELGHVTGQTASPDMLERIFSDFCIGK